MRSEAPQNRGGQVRLLTDDDDFWDAAELCDQVIATLQGRHGSVRRAIAHLTRHYGLKTAWLQRLRERRKVPVYRSAYNNLVVALEDALARREAEIALEKARLKGSRTITNATREIGLPTGLGIASARNTPALVE